MSDQPPVTETLGTRMAKGAAWMVLVKFAERALGLVSTMILARLLVPADFGLVAMAMSVYAVLEIMGAFSFDLALIQNQRAERKHYDTAWTLNVLFGVATAVGLLVLAAPVASFFRESRLEAVVQVLAVSALVQGFENIGVVAFRKELDFRREFNFLLVKKLVSVTGTILLALWLRNYWALALGAILARGFGVIISYRLHPYRPRLALSATRDLLGFSGWALLNNVLIFLNVRGYDFLIGRLLGARALGLYSVAYEISNLPTTELVWPVTRALFPAYARLADDRSALAHAFLGATAVICLLAIPMGVGVAVLAGPVVTLVLGANWLDAVPLMQVLAAYGVLRAVHGGTGSVYLALGLPRFVAFIQTILLVVAVPLALVMLPQVGVIGAAWAVVVAAAVAVPVNLAMVIRLLNVSLVQVVARLWRPTAAASLMLCVLIYLLNYWPPSVVTTVLILQIVTYVLFGATAYCGSVLLLWVLAGRPQGGEALLLSRVAPRFLHRPPDNVR